MISSGAELVVGALSPAPHQCMQQNSIFLYRDSMTDFVLVSMTEWQLLEHMRAFTFTTCEAYLTLLVMF